MSEERKYEIALTTEGALLTLPCVNQRGVGQHASCMCKIQYK